MENEIITTGIEEVTELSNDIVATNQSSNGAAYVAGGIGIGLALYAGIVAIRKVYKKHKAKKTKVDDEDAIHQDLDPVE